MATFEDVYTIPNLAYEISSYLNVDDEMVLDRVSKAIHDTNREWVYGMYREVNVDHMIDQASSVEVAMNYLKKLGPYIQTIVFDGNRHEIHMPPIEKFPNLRSIEYAMPLVVDVSWRSISPSTHRMWKSIRDFMTSLTKQKNQVRSIRIVPGVIKLVQTPMDRPDVREIETVLEDRSPESHLRLYRYLRMPINLWVDWSKFPNLVEFHGPFELLSYGSRESIRIENLGFTDWPKGTSGILYMASQLFGF